MKDAEEKRGATEPKSIPVVQLRECAWNTHRASHSEDEDYQGLISSIDANGMIHRVAVRELEDGAYEIIDGHRRVEAAVALGWHEIPCEVHAGLSDAEAQEMTLTANVQRLDNDPILEAECIERLANAGKNYEQIAAVLGKDTRYVARRARICNLSEKWRAALRDSDATADELERIAAYEKPLQDKVYDELEIDPDDLDTDIESIVDAFRRRLRKIDGETPFDTAKCATCPYNTATHGWLFAREDGEDGCCQDAACFEQKRNAAVDAQIEALRAKKVEVKSARQRWDVPNSWSATEKKTKTNTHPWVYEEDGLRYLVWTGPDRTSAAPALTKAEIEAQRAVKKAHRTWVRDRASAYLKMREIMKDGDAMKRVAHEIVCLPDFPARAERDLLTKWGTYVYDSCLQEVYEALSAERLEDLGCKAFTPEEVRALMAEDPATAKPAATNGEEA